LILFVLHTYMSMTPVQDRIFQLVIVNDCPVV
jgi:hypothetical protein